MKQWFIALCLLLSTSSSFAASAVTTPTEDNDTITLYFVRHGKTLFNTFDRVQGWADSPLTSAGQEMARYVGAGLSDIKFDRFYSSDAGRQRETLALILEQLPNTTPQKVELLGLREAFFGGFEGDFNKTMVVEGAKQLGLASSDEFYRKMAAGELPIEQSQNALAAADPKGLAEDYSKVKQRTQEALHFIVDNARAHGDKTVLVISSGTAIQIMISDLTDNNDKNKPLANAAVVKITYSQGNYNVEAIGDMSYLARGKERLAQS